MALGITTWKVGCSLSQSSRLASVGALGPLSIVLVEGSITNKWFFVPSRDVESALKYKMNKGSFTDRVPYFHIFYAG